MCELHGFDDIIDDVDDFEKYDPVRDADTYPKRARRMNIYVTPITYT